MATAVESGGDGPSSWCVEPSRHLRAAVEAANAGRELTLDQVGALFGLSKECVRQVQKKAMAKIGLGLGVDVEQDYRDGVLGFRRGRLCSDAEGAAV